jgi:NAD+ synthase
MSNFNAKEVKNKLVQWIQDWFEQNGKDCNAVVGISGGLDSSVVSTLCVEALGKDRVIAVKMPDNYQSDEDIADMLINHLDIKSYRVNIHEAKLELYYQLVMENEITLSEQTKINISPRIRMTTLYAISQSVNGRVANTSNLSESWVGYDTKFGDSAGDFSPLFNLTKTEIRLIGKELGLPEELVNKTPIDGLCGQTDEDRFGFTYEVLDKYIRTGICENEVIKNKIDTMHEKNLFKLQPMPSFKL